MHVTYKLFGHKPAEPGHGRLAVAEHNLGGEVCVGHCLL